MKAHVHTNQEIYIVRHGETDYNSQSIIQGRGVNTSLNETGRHQAFNFFRSFSHIHFDSLICSSLNRSKETLDPFTDLGHSIDQYPELDEIDWGDYEGHVPNGQMKEVYREILQHWRDGYVDTAIQNGESPLTVQKRQKRFINNVLANLDGRILICMHGRAMRVFICTLLNQSLSQMDAYEHQNLTLYKLIGSSGNYEIEWYLNRADLDQSPEIIDKS